MCIVVCAGVRAQLPERGRGAARDGHGAHVQHRHQGGKDRGQYRSPRLLHSIYSILYYTCLQ